jgi:hypothetical protein
MLMAQVPKIMYTNVAVDVIDSVYLDSSPRGHPFFYIKVVKEDLAEASVPFIKAPTGKCLYIYCDAWVFCLASKVKKSVKRQGCDHN